MKKTIYVSGPMSGLPDLNFPAFHAAAAELRALGHTVVNPAEKQSEGDPAMTWADYMRQDLAMMMDCDTIYMLPGWQQSKGATLEHHVAVQLGFSVVGASA